MSNTNDPLVMKILEMSPATLGLFSPQGECLLISRVPSLAHEGAPDSPALPQHLKDLFPCISSAAEFWHAKIASVISAKRPVHVHHVSENDGPLLIVLFPCPAVSHDSAQDNVGMITLKMPKEISSESTLVAPRVFSDRMVSVIGHELRNPLSAIGAGLRVLEISAPDTPTEEVTGMMRRQLTQASRLVNDLLDVSRLSHKELSLSLKDALLHEVITLSLDGVQHRLGAKKHRLSIDVPDEPVTLFCDAGRLSQAVTNLLHNAAKYTPPGGHITLSVKPDKDQVVISVSDNGIGIPSERINSIFEPFFQIEEAAAHSDGGVGLGLFLVKAIANGHGGAVRASSNGDGQGAEFAISIPVRGPLSGKSNQETSGVGLKTAPDSSKKSKLF